MPRELALRGEAGFSMVEIAISLAILAFALIAILGVLPLGLTVQKENRDDTVINQEGLYFLEAIRGGTVGLDELTNFVEEIRLTNSTATGSQTFIWSSSPDNPNRLTNGQQIIGLLSIPDIEVLTSGGFRTNTVEARVRAITGNAAEKGVSTDFAFRYQLRVQISRFGTGFPIVSTNAPDPVTRVMANQLFEVRLLTRWPVTENGTDSWRVGRGRRVFRTSVAGRLAPDGPEALGGGYFSYRFVPYQFLGGVTP